ncbi:hypothetical protein DKZ22_07395 [Limosilactobacillus reuteri]|uniref:DNA-binding protein n=1 Tax=Limosilactobacillus reuteri TaxID=1598 RepID=A0A855XMY9_LIMRT|nr:hypothetical protein [Limosilactobacillus reuteri]PWT35174.1 hypothetical protein DKZ24_04940 [Limosilactobacillus reuteri]PWT40988.1 hypothetical protein DKZ22_07395 [Limosilactobacillus reuteri]PWT53809.1 hypothetical protein DKZ31_07515 [Limosilactobacillus reuteri]PWT59792.1 hypothetical protein DKZ30_04895 [Limosilactobacillus reuteri]PWT64493.1 hypothetical protein DKZ20_04980 [Limosilactobacillus reuteri]
MKQLDQDEKKILQLLPKGIAQPKPLKELVKLSGLKEREVRGIIYRLIVLHHVPIGAQYNRPNGYYIITNNKERQQALAPLTSQITMMSKRAQAISNADLESEE